MIHNKIEIMAWNKADGERYDALLKGLNDYIKEQQERGIKCDVAVGIYERKRKEQWYKEYRASEV